MQSVSTLELTDIRKQVNTLQIAERFFDSIVLFALFDTGVLRLLASRPKTWQELHAPIGGDVETLRATLDAAVALDVLSIDDEQYSASEELLDCLGREGSDAYLGEWVAFLHALAQPLLQLNEAIRDGSTPGALFEDMSGDNLPAKRMTQAMDAYARTRGIEIADRLDFSGIGTLLDLGCGPGTYSLAIMERFPNVKATLLDLPGPIAEARRIVEARGWSDRVVFEAMDARDYRPDQPFDAVLVSNTLHMIGEEGSRGLMKTCYDLVAPGGQLLVQAQYLNDDRQSPRWPTLLSLIQVVATPTGRNHAIGETSQWMQDAGFENVEFKRFSTWNVCSCLIGHKPA